MQRITLVVLMLGVLSIGMTNGTLGNFNGSQVFQLAPQVSTSVFGFTFAFTADRSYGIVGYILNNVAANNYSINLQSVTNVWNATTMQWNYQTVGSPIVYQYDNTLYPTGVTMRPTPSVISANGNKFAISGQLIGGTVLPAGLYYHNTSTGALDLALRFDNLTANVVALTLAVATGKYGNYYSALTEWFDGITFTSFRGYYFIEWNNTSPSPRILPTSYTIALATLNYTMVGMDSNETVVAFYYIAKTINFTLSTGAQGAFPACVIPSTPPTSVNQFDGIKIETTPSEAMVAIAASQDGAGFVRSFHLTRDTIGGWGGTWTEVLLPGSVPISGLQSGDRMGSQISLVFMQDTNRWRIFVGSAHYNASAQGAVLVYENVDGVWNLLQRLAPFGQGTTNVNANLGLYFSPQSLINSNGTRLLSSGPCLDNSCPGAIYTWEASVIPPPPPPTPLPPAPLPPVPPTPAGPVAAPTVPPPIPYPPLDPIPQQQPLAVSPAIGTLGPAIPLEPTPVESPVSPIAPPEVDPAIIATIVIVPVIVLGAVTLLYLLWTRKNIATHRPPPRRDIVSSRL